MVETRKESEGASVFPVTLNGRLNGNLAARRGEAQGFWIQHSTSSDSTPCHRAMSTVQSLEGDIPLFFLPRDIF